MSTIKRVLFLVLGLVTFHLFTNSDAYSLPLLHEEQSGRVVGVVLTLVDGEDVRVPGATITIKGRDFERKLESGEAGEFEVSLPAGTYSFTVETPRFCMFNGKLLKVKPRTTEMINIHLKPQPCGPHNS